MPDLTTAHKVPRPLGTDPVGQGDDTARALAAYLEGLPYTTLSLAAGWSGGVQVERAGLVTTVYVEVSKASYGVVETITNASTPVPLGSRPRKVLYVSGAVNPVDGKRRGFQIGTDGVVKCYGYDDAAVTGGIIGQITYVAVPA